MTRVGVFGAAGRMGAEVCRAVAAADDLELVAAVDPGTSDDGALDATGTVPLQADRQAVLDARADVVVDFTHPDAVHGNVGWLLDHRVHAVVGTTGLTSAQVDDLTTRATASGARALLAPNFAIGAVLMMDFAARAAAHMPHVEIIELHHDRKADAPSGTALRTVELINRVRTERPAVVGGDQAHPGARGTEVDGVVVHSVRLPGLVAHQEVLLGGPGQTLSIRHDSLDRTSFMPGVLLAIRKVADLDEPLVVGLEHLL